MKKAFIIVLLLLAPSIVFAESSYTIRTGFAYISRDGVAIGKLTLPVGAEYHTANNETLVEVQDMAVLDSIIVTPPAPPVAQQINDLQFQLDKLDSKSIRCLGSMVDALSDGLDVDPADKATLKDLLQQKKALRQQLKELQ